MHGLFHRFRLRRGFHHHPIDRVGDVSGILSAVALYPQVFHLFMNPSSNDLSPLTFGIIAVNSAGWLAYAIHRRVGPLIISSTANLTAGALIFVMILDRSRL